MKKIYEMSKRKILTIARQARARTKESVVRKQKEDGKVRLDPNRRK